MRAPDAASEASAPEPPRRRRWPWLLLVAGAALAALIWLTRPPQVAAFAVSVLGDALGLEIRADGVSEYRWRGMPSLTLREVTATEPGASTPLLRARRVHVRLPWRTLRSRGQELTLDRIELDSPQVDLAALQHWLAARPPGEDRPFRITGGVGIRQGVLRGENWRVEGIALEVPALEPQQRLDARGRGRYVAGTTGVDFDLHLALDRPALPTDMRMDGWARVTTPDWRLPAQVTLSGPLDSLDGALRVRPLRFGAAARYVAPDGTAPFRLGLAGPLSIGDSAIALRPATLALRPRPTPTPSLIPVLRGRGALALEDALHIELDGRLADWPAAWPALPPPIGQSRAPLPVVLRYHGASDLSDVTRLELRRDATRFEGRFRLPEVLAWLDAGIAGSPLPPMTGRLETPSMEVAGASLEGVRIEIAEEGAP